MKVTSKSSSQWYDVDPVTCVSAAGATEANPTPNASGGSYGPDRRIAHPQTSHLCSGAICRVREMLGISLGTAKTVGSRLTYLRAGLAVECLSEARETADLPIAAPEIRAVRVGPKANQCRFGLDELSPHPGRRQEE